MSKAKQPRYLVRREDFHIFERDPENNCYRSYCTRAVTDRFGRRPRASKKFTLENLTKNDKFIPIAQAEIPYYLKKHNDYCEELNRRTQPDGHGDID